MHALTQPTRHVVLVVGVGTKFKIMYRSIDSCQPASSCPIFQAPHRSASSATALRFRLALQGRLTVGSYPNDLTLAGSAVRYSCFSLSAQAHSCQLWVLASENPLAREEWEGSLDMVSNLMASKDMASKAMAGSKQDIQCRTVDPKAHIRRDIHIREAWVKLSLGLITFKGWVHASLCSL